MAKDTFLNRKTTLNIGGGLLDLRTPHVMAILNITPDSFYAASRTASIEEAMKKTAAFLEAGATIIDIGAYSSRPGAADITEQEELDRIVPVVEALVKAFPEAVLSIDTFRPPVAKATVEAGAHIINDISGGTLDDRMFETVAALNVPYILMHMKGSPQTMHIEPHYDDVVLEVVDYFSKKVAALRRLGVKDIILDPGFGFAKNRDHSYELLNHLEDLKIFGLSLLVGFSRKSMISKFLKVEPADALNGTTVLNTIALQKGASILRVHDVRAALECIKLVERTQRR
ncbi:dihydropteroate synthase [Pedobacter quisquiliarum]|uniref:dihydropteroate synthase n=1 Tax=Pedobacter quisquiliarum TaxID=1834438 RepID=A0A916UEE4_9SPHI|nr:dihydropteroate synthase [Pedobacter quisquiliarum]GGC69275.1 dihydropteroate synthase [Pedobacter quisquiliarum]